MLYTEICIKGYNSFNVYKWIETKLSQYFYNEINVNRFILMIKHDLQGYIQ